MLNSAFTAYEIQHGHNPYVTLGLTRKIASKTIIEVYRKWFDNQRKTNDGIVVHSNLIGKYRYWNDRETYKSELFLIFAVPYHSDIPGEALISWLIGKSYS